VRIIKQSHEFLNLSDPYQLIELAGRTCYKSESRITDKSAENFVKMLISRGHWSVLEHAWITIAFTDELLQYKILKSRSRNHMNLVRGIDDMLYVSGNIRAWFEFLQVCVMPNVSMKLQQLLPEIGWWQGSCVDNNEGFTVLSPVEMAMHATEASMFETCVPQTVRFITNRGVTHELVRHRKNCSYSQESTRFVRYDKNVQFIIPIWMTGRIDDQARTWCKAMGDSETAYKSLLHSGWTPGQAREVLPNSLKTEIVMTTTLDMWKHILEQRCSEAAHPQMRNLMLGCLEEFRCKYPTVFGDLYARIFESQHTETERELNGQAVV